MQRLSLAEDYQGAKQTPLTNLDFKIERGDSLTARDPQEIPDLFRKELVERADRLADLKGQFLSTYGAVKKKLAERIYAEEAELRASLHDLGEPGASAGEPGALATGARPVDWRVAFGGVVKNGGFG